MQARKHFLFSVSPGAWHGLFFELSQPLSHRYILGSESRRQSPKLNRVSTSKRRVPMMQYLLERDVLTKNAHITLVSFSFFFLPAWRNSCVKFEGWMHGKETQLRSHTSIHMSTVLPNTHIVPAMSERCFVFSFLVFFRPCFRRQQVTDPRRDELRCWHERQVRHATDQKRNATPVAQLDACARVTRLRRLEHENFVSHLLSLLTVLPWQRNSFCLRNDV